MRILVTGGAGFIGSNFIRYFLRRYPETTLINVDLLTYAGNVANMEGFTAYPGYRFLHADINDREKLEPYFAAGLDAVVNFAAESHVDRSIEAPLVFARTNINGTLNLLALAQQYGVKRFLQISTDEVYGALGPEGLFTEESPLAPNSPYAASKAGADLLVLAFYKTYGLPVLITRCSNNYGPYQFPEKLIPLAIINAVRDEPVPSMATGSKYGTGSTWTIIAVPLNGCCGTGGRERFITLVAGANGPTGRWCGSSWICWANRRT